MSNQAKSTLMQQAKAREVIDGSGGRSSRASIAIDVGLLVSALLTIYFFADMTTKAYNSQSTEMWAFGILVGIVAVVPAEIGLKIWLVKLSSDVSITGTQKTTAVVAAVLAGFFSSMTTSSFFTSAMPQLFPDRFLAVMPIFNVIAIVGSWVVFIMSVTIYHISSVVTQQNLGTAKAENEIFKARNDVKIASATAMRNEGESLINKMSDSGIFAADARQMILVTLGIDEDRFPAAASRQITASMEDATEPQMIVGRPFGLPSTPSRPNVADVMPATEQAQMKASGDDGKPSIHGGHYPNV